MSESIGSTIPLAIFLSYLFVAGLRRLVFNKLSSFPGPWLAGLSGWYRAYYDVVKFGGLLDQVKYLHEIYGPVVRIGPNELHFQDPGAYFDIYSYSNFTKEPSLYNSFPFHQSSISFLDPLKASRRRDVLSPLFSRAAILKLETVIQEKVDKLIARLASYTNSGIAVDMHMAFRSTTMDIITAYCFANCFDALDAPDFKHPILVGLQTGITSSWILKYLPWLLYAVENAPDWMIDCLPREHQFFRDLRLYASTQIDGFLADPESLDLADQITIFHHLLSPHPKFGGSPSRMSLMGETMALLAAGHDTVGGACTVGTYHILRNPQVQQKLVKELCNAWPEVDTPMTYQALEKLPYLTAVIKESLRLSHGIVSSLPRVTGENIDISGYNIPRGTVVSMSAIFMHLRPDVFPEPFEFDPERWLKSGPGELTSFLVPFSRGSRMCLGINLAWCELYLLFANIFRKTDLTVVGSSEHDYKTFRDFFVPVWDGNRLHVAVGSSPGMTERL